MYLTKTNLEASKLVLVKYILLCLKISGKNSIKHLIGKK